MEINPFGVVRIGSTVKMSGKFGKTVLSSEARITKMAPTTWLDKIHAW